MIGFFINLWMFNMTGEGGQVVPPPPQYAMLLEDGSDMLLEQGGVMELEQ